MADLKEVLDGLQILYAEGANSICAEHDVIYAGPDNQEISEPNRKALESLHWFWDTEANSWSVFV
mgnify:CR=1 FL=1